MNIEVKEILVHGSPMEYMNSASPINGLEINHVKQITDLIQNIASHTVEHQAPQMITRAITDEFTFYPKDSPLTLDEYKQIISNIAEMAAKFPPDIHLVLSSFPVLWPDGGIHNCVLYVESPTHADEKPVIHHFSKQNHAPNDRSYTAESREIKLTTDANCNAEQQPSMILKDTPVSVNDINQYGGAIKIRTADNTELIVATSICKDHFLGVEREHIHGLIEQLNKSIESVPLNCSQVITSAGQGQYNIHTLSSVSHVDVSSESQHEYYPHPKGFTASSIDSSFSGKLTTEIYPPKLIGTLHSDLFQHAVVNVSPEILAEKLNRPDINGNTMLHRVFLDANHDRELIAKRLYTMIINGGNPAILNKNLKSIRDLANEMEMLEAEKFILKAIDNALVWREHRQEINTISTPDLRSALTQSVIARDFDSVFELIVNGANLYLKDGAGQSAIDIIEQEYNLEEQHNIKPALNQLALQTQYGYVKQEQQYGGTYINLFGERLLIATDPSRWFTHRETESFQTRLSDISTTINEPEQQLDAYLHLFEDVEKNHISRDALFSKAVELLIQCITNLTPEKRSQMFSNDILSRVLSQMRTAGDLIHLMKISTSEERLIVLKHIESRLPPMIHTANELYSINSLLPEDAFALVLNSLLPRLPAMIQSANDLYTITNYVSFEEVRELLAKIENHIPDLLQSADDLSILLDVFTQKEIDLLFEKYEPLIVEVLQTYLPISRILKSLPQEKLIPVLNKILATDIPAKTINSAINSLPIGKRTLLQAELKNTEAMAEHNTGKISPQATMAYYKDQISLNNSQPEETQADQTTTPFPSK